MFRSNRSCPPFLRSIGAGRKVRPNMKFAFRKHYFSFEQVRLGTWPRSLADPKLFGPEVGFSEICRADCGRITGYSEVTRNRFWFPDCRLFGSAPTVSNRALSPCSRSPHR